jgi:glyoxylase-like metal-dependent hydrolase (beta-lactamase superfamily II)
MVHEEVADGVHRVEDAFTNWYLVEGDDGLTIVDAGVPLSWGSLFDVLAKLGRSTDDLRAVVLTHAHFDHVGFAERARLELGLPVWVHENDAPLARHPRQYLHERARLPYFATQVKALPIVAALLRARAFWPRAVREVSAYSGGELAIPGRPRVVPTPGHTLGHCALSFPDRGVLIAGDAFVMLDPYTGDHGPKIVAGAATADSARNLASLDALLEVDERVILTGHGEPWREGAEAAVSRARAAGPS